jgi:hypothetical protein
MLGFSPLASAPLADDGLVKVELTPVSVSTQVTSVANVTLTQVHSLSSPDISTGTPTVASSSLEENYPLSTSDISTGTPVVDNPVLTQNFALVPSSISTGSPEVNSAALSQVHIVSTTDISTGASSVDATDITQVHSVSLSDTTSGSPATGNPDLDEEHSVTLSSVTTGSPTLGSPVCNAFDLVLSANDLTAGTPILANQRTEGYDSARSDYFDNTVVTGPVTILDKGSVTGYRLDSTFWSIRTASISENSSTITFETYHKRIYTNGTSQWYDVNITLYKTGNTVASYSEGSQFNQSNHPYNYGAPPNSSFSGYIDLPDLQDHLNNTSDYDWMDHDFVNSSGTDASAYPVYLSGSLTSASLKRVSDNYTYDSVTTGNISVSGTSRFAGKNYRLAVGLPVPNTNYVSQFSAARFDPSFNFTQTNDATLTHLETGLGLIGFDTGVPVVGNATLVLDQQIAANGVSSGIPVVGSPSSTESHVLSPSDVEAQLPVVAATSISQDHSVEAVDTSTQSPVLQSPDVDQDHVLGASEVSAGTPVVGSTTVSEFQVLGSPVEILTGVPEVGNATFIRNNQFAANDVSAGTPVVGSPDLTEVTLSVSLSSITTGSPDLTNVVLLQDHLLAADDVTTALAEVGQTSFVFKGKIGALNSVTVNLSKNSTTVNLSRNSVG